MFFFFHVEISRWWGTRGTQKDKEEEGSFEWRETSRGGDEKRGEAERGATRSLDSASMITGLHRKTSEQWPLCVRIMCVCIISDKATYSPFLLISSHALLLLLLLSSSSVLFVSPAWRPLPRWKREEIRAGKRVQEGKNSREESDKERNNEGFDSMWATLCISVCMCVCVCIYWASTCAYMPCRDMYNLIFCKQKIFYFICSRLNLQ